MGLRVTWIAPTIPGLPELGWLNELTKLKKLTHVALAMHVGDALTLDDIAGALCEPCDVLIWAGHGIPGAFILPGGVLVRARWLAAQVAGGCFPRVAVLAACASGTRIDLRSMMEMLVRSGVTCIGFPVDTDDATAARFCLEFVRSLASNASISDAFDVGMESIVESKLADGVVLTPGIENVSLSLLSRLDRIEERQLRILAALNVPIDDELIVPGRSRSRPRKAPVPVVDVPHIQGLPPRMG